ncbi:nucleotide kinase domain-containing protein [Winogradskyella sp. SYSU M77433]|uniref:nucleotide kinase domain-containing protein n=1 Tax=Winogradskyella sp. SYSU M77433 TaxID=3042722 RepID=UPI00248175F6|nr:nucleotide kinase domain-containing protein [Winogradskyella sp. SYSU M77433]MDH7912076.1 putative DNA base hypermodification protein [Winogradskyella sp. SYSU M77433]
MIELSVKKTKPKESEVYKTYWEFAGKRQEVFFNRINNEDEWTNDDIIAKYKFTNVYRASDRVSQYLIKNVIYNGSHTPSNLLFRILLFKTFNKIETWQYLESRLGQISFDDFDFKVYDDLLNYLKSQNVSIYSGAYIMTSGKSTFGYNKKHQNHLRLIEFMLKDNLDERVADCKSLEELFLLLKQYPTIGNFLAYQYAIDINYSELTDFSEMDYVYPGPGAKDGIKKCFVDTGGFSETDIIKYITDRQEFEFQKFNINFKTLWGRSLQLIDCQNLFCEVDKYARVAHPDISGISGRTRIKQIFSPKASEIDYWYPPQWGLNDKVKVSLNE